MNDPPFNVLPPCQMISNIDPVPCPTGLAGQYYFDQLYQQCMPLVYFCQPFMCSHFQLKLTARPYVASVLPSLFVKLENGEPLFNTISIWSI